MNEKITNQLRNLPLLIAKEMCSGAIYIATGPNVGLGFEAAKHLVAMGSNKAIMAVRNLEAGDDAKVDI